MQLVMTIQSQKSICFYSQSTPDWLYEYKLLKILPQMHKLQPIKEWKEMLLRLAVNRSIASWPLWQPTQHLAFYFKVIVRDPSRSCSIWSFIVGFDEEY